MKLEKIDNILIPKLTQFLLHNPRNVALQKKVARKTFKANVKHPNNQEIDINLLSSAIQNHL